MTDPDLVEVDLRPHVFMAHAAAEGWSDGLPLIPPVAELVDEHVQASGRGHSDVVGDLPPSFARCTVRLLAANAVMAGAPPESMPLLITAIEAMLMPDFDLPGMCATTGSVVPALVVNGDLGPRLGIASGASCLGGDGGAGVAIGRALRLVLQNVGGLIPGRTSQTVFGQPARVTGITLTEDEGASPWDPLAVRRGVVGDAVTVYGAQGTTDLCDITVTHGRDLVASLARSATQPASAALAPSTREPEVMLVICPVWANFIAHDVATLEEVQYYFWANAKLPITTWPVEYRHLFEERERVDANGDVHLVDRPDDLLIAVAGGVGGHHTSLLPSWGNTRAATRRVA